MKLTKLSLFAIGIIFFVLSTFLLTSCEKEYYAIMHYNTNLGVNVNIEDRVDDEPQLFAAFKGKIIDHKTGEVTGYFYHIEGYTPESITILFKGDSSEQCHFEGGGIREFFIGGLKDWQGNLAEYIPGSGMVDLTHNGHDYLEGTFSGKFLRQGGRPDGTPSGLMDTIAVTNGYFKSSVRLEYDIS